MKIYFKYLVSVVILISLDTYAQENGNIKLKLIDKENKTPIPEANVKITNTVYSSITDKNGVVTFTNLKPDKYSIEISRLGYKPEKLKDAEVLPAKTTEIVVEMKESIITLEDVVVTAGKTEQAAKDIANSVSVIDAVKISNTNSARLDEALNYVSGINFSLSQISIRGSSGFGLGVGSRVLVLLDGIPILTGDTGGMTWENLALNQIERIEIIKGSGSA
ncbi:MAG: TonB-dependent receptor plug domain-containing protein, partial [Ignavibacteria bacterium]